MGDAHRLCLSSLVRRDINYSIPHTWSPRVSSASSLTCLTRGARYARAEAALRVALSRCDNEPSPLQLQVRVLEKGLHAWNARAGRGYERVRKAEETLEAARRRDEEDSGDVRGSFGQLQREKWMGMKERDEALAMVEKIKGLIKDLSTDIKEGLKVSSHYMELDPPLPQKASLDDADEVSSKNTASKKAAIIFSGRFPQPYLEKLPRSRRSVEPLRLPLQISNHSNRSRSSTLHSEHAGTTTPSTPSTTHPSTPHPATPTDGFGAAFISVPFPLKSMAQYLAEMDERRTGDIAESRDMAHSHGHMKLPSYVGALLDELGEDRLSNESLHIGSIVQPFTIANPAVESTESIQGMTSPLSTIPNSKLRSKRLLGRPFSTSPGVGAHTPSRYLGSKGDREMSMIPQQERFVSEEEVDSNTSTGESPSSPALMLLGSDVSSSPRRPPPIKSPGRVGILMQSVKKGVRRVARKDE